MYWLYSNLLWFN